MKTSRNEPCKCGSGKKYKNCCGIKNFENSVLIGYTHWIVLGFISICLVLTLWGVIGYFTSENPEMEAFKCDNPNCDRIHYRPKTDTN